jgi:N-acylneuraminate cytidylyltransferase
VNIDMSKIISIIPARGGSKGVPGKNIKLLNEIPLIGFSIKTSLESKHITRTIVSTDSVEIANIAKELGAEVPFLRPKVIAGDKSTDLEFFLHTIDWFLENEGEAPDYFVHLRPTTPLRDFQVVDKAIASFLKNSSATALRSVHEMSETAYKSFEIEEGKLKTIGTGSFDLDPANEARQGFPSTYYANGYVDIIKSKFIIDNQKIHGDKVMAFVTEPVTEVDTPEDFELLEYQCQKYKI